MNGDATTDKSLLVLERKSLTVTREKKLKRLVLFSWKLFDCLELEGAD